jgi:lipoprotein-anchoring transpeptidase ErfK/SrfK
MWISLPLLKTCTLAVFLCMGTLLVPGLSATAAAPLETSGSPVGASPTWVPQDASAFLPEALLSKPVSTSTVEDVMRQFDAATPVVDFTPASSLMPVSAASPLDEGNNAASEASAVTPRTDTHRSRGMLNVPGTSAAPEASKETTADTPKAQTKIVIHVPSRTLSLWAGGQLLKRYPVGLGRPGFPTPVGSFRILRKLKHPSWENPYLSAGKMVLPAGDDNPLGTRWMGFHAVAHGEYGIHGTDQPQTVGKYSSHGCVRMRITDAEDLFERVSVGTQVEIKGAAHVPAHPAVKKLAPPTLAARALSKTTAKLRLGQSGPAGGSRESRALGKGRT